MNKKILGFIVVAIVLAILYYLISPLWRNKELNEESPLTSNSTVINDKLNTMSAEEKAKLELETTAVMNKDITMQDVMPQEEAKIISQATLVPRAHDVEGNVLLIQKGGDKILRFENLNTINGPDLVIYLASDLSDKDFISLGSIKATKGNVNYQVPAGTDTNKYNKVLIWCKAFSVLFSYGELK